MNIRNHSQHCDIDFCIVGATLAVVPPHTGMFSVKSNSLYPKFMCCIEVESALESALPLSQKFVCFLSSEALSLQFI
jgi:hypothetical protein